MSEIHGIGIFAKNLIPKGALIWQFEPKYDLVVSEKSINSLPEDAKETFLKYAYKSSNENYVLCFDDARFFNHSDNPNTIDDTHEGGKVVAARDILPMEEITSDYRVYDLDYARKLGI